MLTNLQGLSSLLCICEQLDGESSGVMQHVLQVGHTVAHVSPHTALPTDGHRAILAEKTQYLWEDKDRASPQLFTIKSACIQNKIHMVDVDCWGEGDLPVLKHSSPNSQGNIKAGSYFRK